MSPFAVHVGEQFEQGSIGLRGPYSTAAGKGVLTSSGPRTGCTLTRHADVDRQWAYGAYGR